LKIKKFLKGRIAICSVEIMQAQPHQEVESTKTTEEAAAALRILRLPGMGPVGFGKLSARLFRRGIPIQRILELSDQQLAELHFNVEQINALRNPGSDAVQDLQQCAQEGICVLTPADPQYPLRILALLKRTAPPLLFARGNLDLLHPPAVGISGSRKASDAGLASVTRICQMASRKGWVIVSGGARGADEAAHLAGIQSGVGTIIVLPTGIFRPNLRNALKSYLGKDNTLILSEFPPEFGWTNGCAMQRNRLLAALSRVLVLVEPGFTGGTGGTGRIAMRLKLPVYILKPTPDEAAAEAALQFIAKGAHPLQPDLYDPDSLIMEFEERCAEMDKERKRSEFSALFTDADPDPFHSPSLE
jgi:DNA protecting protein DprA